MIRIGFTNRLWIPGPFYDRAISRQFKTTSGQPSLLESTAESKSLLDSPVLFFFFFLQILFPFEESIRNAGIDRQHFILGI